MGGATTTQKKKVETIAKSLGGTGRVHVPEGRAKYLGIPFPFQGFS